MTNIVNIKAYILLINVVEFILYYLYKKLRPGIFKSILSGLLYIIAIGGGGLGSILAILIFYRRASKEGLSLKVFAFVSFAIELILYLLVNNDVENINLDFLGYFKIHPYLLAYIGLVNFITFLVFAYDKYRAKNSRWRLKNGLLLGLSFIGGALGGLIAMKVLRHKTKKTYYKIGLPLMVLMQALLTVYFMN
ncbi:DUF1294 domain-containing protein [uncultured Anaerococcus sp.]|uniref:DUF1294 domain-containing protein n=1 Tax=uncultured Anaerococcus sp. TaxID=293428 RepID=UPI0025ED19D7|nr:DUF1294 domain-containing protein [uncultured Anaerococcus sp.]